MFSLEGFDLQRLVQHQRWLVEFLHAALLHLSDIYEIDKWKRDRSDLAEVRSGLDLPL